MSKGDSTQDSHDLARFLAAQEPVYEVALAELRAGRKRSHWMWFIFPQLLGLGRSSIARYYGITGPGEAAAYLAHPVLGARLLECTQAVLQHPETSIDAIFGYPDTLKFRSCMTLFATVAGSGSLFDKALQAFFEGEPDEETLQLIKASLGDSA